jgi:uncharacterized protein YqhQ
MADEIVGGQALIEGVMMLDGKKQGIAVRGNDGKIVKKKDEVDFPDNWFVKLPFVRGFVKLLFMMIVGIKALNFSASVVDDDTEESGNFGMGVALFVGIFFALALFKFLPLLITTYFVNRVGFLSANNFIPNVIDGVLKVGIFVLYLWMIGLSSEIKRTFAYHGAEHKVIRCFEGKKALTVKNAREFSRFHPRCGTAFIFGVFLISVFVFSLIPFGEVSFWTNFGLRILLLPIVMGISYEVLRLSGKNEGGSVFFRIITAPGLWFQRFTTFEPDNKQLEVGIAALKEALKKN